jgi:hypothetical protein
MISTGTCLGITLRNCIYLAIFDESKADCSKCSVLIRPPGQKNSDRWAFTIGGRKIEDPDRLGQDSKALEKFIRETTQRQDIEITRWDHHISHR